ncbi:MAG TPA: RNase A-like domain-containing protein [Lentibacillus sp.]|uniref:RNase A-like domain-containing protein n=1 Tax=Lentibacillus sp. TaxID=1925746 RepID=UPI002B4B3872|nr:RNase A-like domain-containing protein [Lentibacillus sp.]HLR63259.1 RNase A-like domain-containing protein [Lentibacillus sp.]
MVQRVDRMEIEDFADDVMQNKGNIQTALGKVKTGIITIQNMDSFSGKAAKQSKKYFSDVHVTLLSAFHKLFEDLHKQLQDHIDTFGNEVDSRLNARIKSNYLEDTKEDINDTYEDLQDEKQNINETIESVSDISTAIAPDFSNVTDYYREAVETLVDLQDDLDAFTQKKQDNSIDELLHHIQVTMERAGTVQGSGRFDDYVDLMALEGLPALKATVKAYEQDNMSDQLGLANSIETDIPAEFTALQKQNQFNRDAWPYVAMMYPNMLFPITYRKHGANANNVKPKDIKEQKFIQDLAEQNRMTPGEEIQLQQYLQQLSSGEVMADEVEPVEVNSQHVPEMQGEREYYAREPLTYENKREVMGGHSDLAGDPYTMGHITTAGLNFAFGDIGTMIDTDASVDEKMLAGLFLFGKPVKLVDKSYDLYRGAHRARKVDKNVDRVKPGDKSDLAPGGGLAAHEIKGGHLIERHVGKTDKELLERINKNPKITGSSTFKDRVTAEKVVNNVLSNTSNKKVVQSWLENPKSKSTLVLTYQGTEVIGRGVKKGSDTVKNMTNARVILKKDSNGNFVLTGYPN